MKVKEKYKETERQQGEGVNEKTEEGKRIVKPKDDKDVGNG